MVIINGKAQPDKTYQRCTRCIADSTVPGISFNDDGTCSLCDFHDELCELYPENEEALSKLKKKISEIKREGKNKKYDCIVGLSGGRDSTYLLYLAVRKWKLRPLAVHFNDGFDNPIAIENMNNAVRILEIDLEI